MKPGQPKTPINILKMRGSWLAKTQERQGEPGIIEVKDGLKCPEYLNKRAKKFFKETSKILLAMRILSAGDIHALARYCQTLDYYYQAIELLNSKAQHIIPTHDQNGNIVSYKDRPEMRRQAYLSDMLRAMEREFGLTPAARTGISVTPQKPQNKKEALLNRAQSRAANNETG